MRTKLIDTTFLQHVDIVARDRDGRVVLLVEVKARKASQSGENTRRSPGDFVSEFEPFLLSAKAQGQPIPYLMVVDLDEILVYRSDLSGEVPGTPGPHPGSAQILDSRSLSTVAVLSHYDPKFGPDKSVYETYLTILVEAWLSDLAYHWKSDRPPGIEELAAIGLARCLESGATETRGSRDDDPLY